MQFNLLVFNKYHSYISQETLTLNFTLRLSSKFPISFKTVTWNSDNSVTLSDEFLTTTRSLVEQNYKKNMSNSILKRNQEIEALKFDREKLNCELEDVDDRQVTDLYDQIYIIDGCIRNHKAEIKALMKDVELVVFDEIETQKLELECYKEVLVGDASYLLLIPFLKIDAQIMISTRIENHGKITVKFVDEAKKTILGNNSSKNDSQGFVWASVINNLNLVTTGF